MPVAPALQAKQRWLLQLRLSLSNSGLAPRPQLWRLVLRAPSSFHAAIDSGSEHTRMCMLPLTRPMLSAASVLRPQLCSCSSCRPATASWSHRKSVQVQGAPSRS